MEGSEENMSSGGAKKQDQIVKKPKKRSIVERELETSLTAWFTSPVTSPDGTNVSRYGRARKLKTDEILEKKLLITSPGTKNNPKTPQSPFKKHTVTPCKSETPKRVLGTSLDNQIDNIYQENLSLSRFNTEKSPSPRKTKVYIRKDLIQTKEPEDNIVLIKNLFASPKSNTKTSAEKYKRSEEKYNPQQNGYMDKTSVVKTLDFDSKKSVREKETRILSKNQLFEIEAKCPYQVGDLAWARMGTFPFWPCIVTRDPYTGMFVKKKLCGRVEHDMIHVTFFGDNGRRSWIMDNMLRVYLGKNEFESAREEFSPEEKRRDPRLYAAYFISNKKRALWNASVEEAEILLREPKRLRIDILNDMILKARASKKQQRSGKISRNDSNVSLSESLLDSLFSVEDTKEDIRLRNRLRNRPIKSLDVSDVVTACLDNMAAKTGITKIQKQSHMDRWLQKAKSKTPEKIQMKLPIITSPKVEKKVNSRSKKQITPKKIVINPYSLRKCNQARIELGNMRPESPTFTQPMEEDIQPIIMKTPVKTNSIDAINLKAEFMQDLELNKSKFVQIKDQINIVNALERETTDLNAANVNNDADDIEVAFEPERVICICIDDDIPEGIQTNIHTDKTDGNKYQASIIEPNNQTVPENTEENRALTEATDEYQVLSETNNTDLNTEKDSEQCESILEGNSENSIEEMSIEDSNVSIETPEVLPRNEELQTVDGETVDPNLTVNNEDSNVPIETPKALAGDKESQTVNDEPLDPNLTVNDEPLDPNLKLDVSMENPESIFDTEDSNKNSVDNPNLTFTNEDCNVPIETPKALAGDKESQTVNDEPLDPNLTVNDEPLDPNLTVNDEPLDPNLKLDVSTENPDSIFDTEDSNKNSVDNELINKNSSNDNEDLPAVLNEDDQLGIKGKEIDEIEKDSPSLNFNTNDVISIDENEKIDEKIGDQEIVNINNDNNMSVDDEDTGNVSMTSENNLNTSGDSESILPINGDIEFFEEKTDNQIPKENFEQLGPMINNIELDLTDSAYNSESVPEKMVGNENFHDKYEVAKRHEDFFRNEKEQIVKEKATIENVEVRHEERELIEQNQAIVDEYDTETSDDEPSPEYEPLGEDITEDFRQHMLIIESNITDKKDDEQIVKICTKIIEEEIKKTSPKKDDVLREALTSDCNVNKNLDNTENKIEENAQKSKRTRGHIKKLNEQFDNEPRIESNESNKIQNGDVNYKNEITKPNKTVDVTKKVVDTTKSLNIENSTVKKLNKSEPKVVIIPLERTKIDENCFNRKSNVESVEWIKNKKYSPKTYSNKLKLSLRRKTKANDPVNENGSTNNDGNDPKITEDVITIHKEAKIHKEKVTIEKSIPQTKQNGYHDNVYRKYTDSADIDDDDFDIDAVSLNSEDSEISVTSSNKYQPRRSLRSKPKQDNGLENPEFLKYLELRQDYLIDEHPELNQDEIVTYLYKTWQYEESLKSDAKKSDDVNQSNLVKGLKLDTPNNKKSKKSTPKNRIENYFRQNYNKKKIDFDAETNAAAEENSVLKEKIIENLDSEPVNNQPVQNKNETTPKIDVIDLTASDKEQIVGNHVENATVPEVTTPKRNRDSKTRSPETVGKEKELELNNVSDVNEKDTHNEIDTQSINSEDSEVPLRRLRVKLTKEKINGYVTPEFERKDEDAASIISTNSEDEPLLYRLKKKKNDKKVNNGLENPEFLKFLELRQDSLMDEHPELTQKEIVDYLYKTWLYEENNKSELKKNDEIEQSNLVKGLNQDPIPKKVKRKPKSDKMSKQNEDISLKDKPKRKTIQPYYNEDYSDIEDELELFEIFKTSKTSVTVTSKSEAEKNTITSNNEVNDKDTNTTEVTNTENVVTSETVEEITQNNEQIVDGIELYFIELTKPKPNVFKGLIREKVCEICETTGNLYKCKGCHGMFHIDCVKKVTESADASARSKGRKKKKKLGRKCKGLEDSEGHSDEKYQDISEEQNLSMDETLETITFDAETIEAQLTAKMQEIMSNTETHYDSYSSDDGIDWSETVAGKCEIVDVKLKTKPPPIDCSNFKCNNCQKHDPPICFVCKSDVTKNGTSVRQKCHVAHCHKYYHLECLDHWPQTQFYSGEPSKNNKKINEYFEALTCPRHVCHTCVSDDPRGCKTRFSGDKLARCVRCPATYHSYTKCLPAGSQILTASHIICPRHYQHRPGKVPCHVNTGWCFICALGGSLICCEYCPTSFHAECLNIKPPEGNYMCEDCETGRLPLYGEMVWVKLGHYRWWPGIILHPCEIPENIMAVKHGLGEFVVRFFGQYDHYWVNRGRVFPYQEGDSGRISSQKSKIDAAFTTAMEHAQRAFEILKNAQPNEEESMDIASSLLPPHYVKLKVNKPCGAVCARRAEDPALALTQCECDPTAPQPCGPYSHCLNRMLLTECGPTCRAGDRCNNRQFEKRQYPKLVPYRTPYRGWGLKTLEDIKAGQFVIEYVGELIDEEEFKRRMRRKHEIRDENFYFLTLDKERMIDAGPKGNFARFMNHCCEPNCETQKWTVLGDVRVGLFAIDDIPANSEVTFNYNLECAGIEKKRCLCGAKRCSGYIGAKPKQDESQTKKGKIQKRTYKKRKNNEESPSTSKTNKPKRPIGRPPKAKELTEIEKDLLIIKSATNSVSSDNGESTQSTEENKTLKRKMDSSSIEESLLPSEPKKQKCDNEVGD